MVSPKIDINNTYWTLKNKFRLEVGVENTIDSNYPSIIWFKQGIYIFTSINMNVQSNNFTISISGKDKMCLLNGEFGGTINASTDFGKMEEYRTLDNGEIVRDIIDIPIVDIIKNAVQVYGGEQLYNIILNDIDNYGLELLEYRVKDAPLYMLRDINTDTISNARFSSIYEGIVSETDTTPKEYNFEKKDFIFYNSSALSIENNGEPPTIVYTKGEGNTIKKFNVIKLEYGMTAGYRKTALTYPGELVANVGESLVSVLDKIKNMFGDFEYFYDVDGRFIFQKKKTYVNQSWNPIKKDPNNDVYVDAAIDSSSFSYSFEDGVLLSAFSNQPAINNIKNDFSIWGKRKGVDGQDLPVHLRYAIDKKPTYYFPIRFKYENISQSQWENKDYKYEANKYYIRKNGQYILATETSRDVNKTYYFETNEQIINPVKEASFEGDIVKAFDVSDGFDWRELIYQMALDYFKYNHKKSDFTQLVAAANPEYYPTGVTGYETYYTDMQGFWRQLYFPGVKDGYEALITENEKKQAARAILSEKGDLDITDEDINKVSDEDILKYYKGDYDNNGYNIAISKYPETLNFWFDFMSVDGEMGKYSCSAIGSRQKAINDDKVTAIAFNDVPQVIFILSDNEKDTIDMTGYSFVNLPQNVLNYFTISSQGKSAWDELNSLLYQHTCITESSTLTTVPIYHLTPNTRIYINDRNTGANGEYILNKITISLQYNGTGSLTANKIIKRIY